MRILLSAFACDPTAGSEEGIGWAWAYHLSRLGHEVCVLTNKSYRSAIEEHVSRHSLPRLRFEYIEVRHVPFWIPGGPGLYPYYFCWQWKAYFRAKELHRESHFQIVHHITYGVFRNPSYLYRLKDIKFIFGPVGGGERSPRALRVSMSTKDSFNELCRDFVNLIPRADPFWHSMLRHAARIAVKTEETRACLPEETRGRAVVTLENMMSIGPCLAGDHRTSSLKLIYAGRFLQWKGLHLAVRALALAIKSTKAEFTIIGRDSGKAKEEFRLREQAKNLNVEQFVHFLPWMPKSDVVGLFAAHDALLFPSLHDSGGTIVMEAIAHGTPIICLDLGGPAVTVDERCARIVRTRARTEEQVIRAMADAIVELARMDSGDWVKMRQSALERARFYAPEKVINRVYGDLIELGSGSDESSQWTHDHAVIASRGVDSKGANSGKSAFHQGFRVAPVGLAEMPTPTPSFCAVQASANPCSLSAAPHQRSPDMLRQSLPATLSGRSAKISGAADSVDSGRHARFFMQM